MKSLEFYRLEAFAAVVEQRSFSKAANQLFLSQPTVSAHIKSLENELGVPLFDRGRQEYVLTPAGEALYRYARDMLDLRVRALAEIGQGPDARREKITVVASSVPCQYLLPRAMAAFVRQFPEMSVSLRQKNSHAACSDIFQYRCQLGVVGEKHLPDKLAYLTLLKDELVIAVPNFEEFQPLLDKEKLTFTDLSAYRLLLREPGSATRSLLENALTKSGLTLGSYNYMVFDSQEAIKQAVRQGIGVSVLSRYVIEDYVKFGWLHVRKSADLWLEREFYLVFHPRRVLSPAIIAFRDFLSGFFKEDKF
jgi:DNA-binding transcriptional LysR family regulator